MNDMIDLLDGLDRETKPPERLMRYRQTEYHASKNIARQTETAIYSVLAFFRPSSSETSSTSIISASSSSDSTPARRFRPFIFLV